MSQEYQRNTIDMSVVKNVAMKRGHPGRGKHKTHSKPKGRQVVPLAHEQVRALLGGGLRRDLLLEYLHLVQDEYGHLSSEHLAALADEMKLSQTEVYEVATFYAHFDVVKEGDIAPPATTIRVCDSIAHRLARHWYDTDCLLRHKIVDPVKVAQANGICC